MSAKSLAGGERSEEREGGERILRRRCKRAHTCFPICYWLRIAAEGRSTLKARGPATTSGALVLSWSTSRRLAGASIILALIGDWFSQSSMSCAWPWLANCPLHASEQRRIGEYNAATAPSLVALCRQAAVTCPGLLFCSSTTRCPRALTTGLPSRSTSLPA